MALPFLESGSRRKRDQMVAVDLGSRTTKAVHIQRRGQNLALCGYALLDAPIFDKTISSEMLSEHLRAATQVLGAKTKWVTLTVGVSDALVRTVEMPVLSMDDMRLVLKHNSRTYLQQDLGNYVFDCHVVNAGDKAKSAEANKTANKAAKQKVLVAGAKKQLVDELVAGARNAGLTPDHIVPSLIAPVNAFEKAMPEVFQNAVIALVEVGFKNTVICLLQEGELVVNRTVALGGDRLTASMSETMNISYAEAEGIKVGMAQEVQAALESTLLPLGRELRASIDFFEHQQDKSVSTVFVSGGSARSSVIVQALQKELLAECRAWNPTQGLQLELPPDQARELEQVAPQLAVALGTAVSSI